MPSKNILLLTFLYFIQGLPYGFQARFLPVFLRAQGVSLTNLGLFKLLLAPWLCKAIWAPLVDKYGTKRNWLLWSIFGLVITCSLTSLISPEQLVLLCLMLFLLNLCAATQDIAVDSIAVTILTSSELGQGNTAQVVGYKMGSVFGGGFLVWFIDLIGWTGLFVVLTLLYIEAWMFVYVSPNLRHISNKSSCDSDQTLQYLMNSDMEEDVFEDEESMEISNSDEVDDLEIGTEFSNFEPTADDIVKSDVNNTNDVANSSETTNVNNSDGKQDFKTPQGSNNSPSHSSSTDSNQFNKTSNEARTVEDDSKSGANNVNSDNSVMPDEAQKEDDTNDTSSKDEKDFSAQVITKLCNRLGLSFIEHVLNSPGTTWMMAYVLLYKLGEQGVLGMFPLFLVDQKLDPSTITFWTGMVGQTMSILGSLLGGWIITRFHIPLSLLLQQLCLIRLVPIGLLLWTVVLWHWEIIPQSILYYPSMVLMNLILILSGIITTTTFTFMMHCSKLAQSKIQATHYTVLATLEVFGKLTFMALAGFLVDIFNYPAMFVLFTILTAGVVPWTRKVPLVLEDDEIAAYQPTEGEKEKKE